MTDSTDSNNNQGGEKPYKNVASMSPEEMALKLETEKFVKAFDSCRGTLAAFAKCESETDLHCVRDGFFLGMGAALFPDKYEPIKRAIIADPAVADAAGTASAFEAQITVARAHEGWNDLTAKVRATALLVDSDLDAIWQRLESGRLAWIKATRATHMMKCTLRSALKADGAAKGSPEDVETKMVWIYALGTMLPLCSDAAQAWAKVVGISDPTQPLLDFVSEKWDARLPQWAPLDLGVQAASEAGGTNLDEAWEL